MHAAAARPSTHEHRRLPDGAPLHYEYHRPEQTTLYRLIRQHAASFIAHTEAGTGSALPRFIKDEFDAFLECGILAHGFLRPRCGQCGHGKRLGAPSASPSPSRRARSASAGRGCSSGSSTSTCSTARTAAPGN